MNRGDRLGNGLALLLNLEFFKLQVLIQFLEQADFGGKVIFDQVLGVSLIPACVMGDRRDDFFCRAVFNSYPLHLLMGDHLLDRSMFSSHEITLAHLHENRLD